MIPARRFCGLPPVAIFAVFTIAAGLLRPALGAPSKFLAPVIPDLTPWLAKNGDAGQTAWRHAAHFSIAYEINPGHNTPAPVATRVDAGYTANALWLRFRAQDPHPGDIGLRYREHDDMAGYADDCARCDAEPLQ